jgi:hypothetical protein
MLIQHLLTERIFRKVFDNDKELHPPPHRPGHHSEPGNGEDRKHPAGLRLAERDHCRSNDDRAIAAMIQAP